MVLDPDAPDGHTSKRLNPTRDELDELLRPRRGSARHRWPSIGWVPGDGASAPRSGVVVAVVAVLGLGGLIGYRAFTTAPAVVELPRAEPEADAESAEGAGAGDAVGDGAGDAQLRGVTTSVATRVVVQVSGAVVSPGVVELAAGARWNDAVVAAGGPRADADLGRVNLAAPAVDGSRLYIPAVGADPPPEVVASAAGGGTAAGGPDGGAGGAPSPVDLNTASAEQLDALPGVGPSTAAAILEYRQRSGPFRSVDELDEVAGIGPSRLERLRPLVTAGP